MKLKTAKQLEKQVTDWNRDVPVGTKVKYHPVIGEKFDFQFFDTATQAYVLSGHTAVVHLAGKSGCVALDACEVAK